jgi:hypothetical protein
MDRQRLLILGIIGAGILFVWGIFWRYRLRTHATPTESEEQKPPIEAHAVAEDSAASWTVVSWTVASTWTDDTPSVPEVLTAVTLLLPPFVDQRAVEKTLTQMGSEYGVPTQRRVSDSLESYYKALITIGKKWSGIDIAIVPSDLRDIYASWWYHIPFQESLAPLYHPLLQSYIDSPQATYLPLWLDPAITVYHNALFLNQPTLTLSTLQAALLTAPQQRAVPISIGLSEEMLTWIREPYFGFEDTLSLFLTQAKKQQQARFFDYFLNSSWWDYGQLLTEIDICQKQYPTSSFLWCTTQRQSLGVWFGRMSDSTMWQLSGYTITHLPIQIKDYPIKSRWVMLNKSSPQLKSALQWTKWLLTIQHRDSVSLWAPTLLQADTRALQNQLIDTDFALWQTYLDKALLHTWVQSWSHQSLLQDPLMQKVIQWSYNLELYITK